MNEDEKYLSSRIEELTKSSSKIWREIQELSDELSQIRVQKILDSGVLSKITWEVKDLNGGTWIYAEAIHPIYEPKVIFDLLTDSHSSHHIFHDLELTSNDGQLYLRFPDIPTILKYKKELGLRIETFDMRDKLDQFEKRFLSLQRLLEELE